MKIVNHRGANLERPENTFEAAALSIEQGADFIELDIRESSDGVPFVIHDYTLDRTTNATGPVRYKTAEQLDQVDAGNAFAAEYGGTNIPRFREYAEFISGKCGMQVEFKTANFQNILRIVTDAGFAPDDVRFCTFTPDIFADMRASRDPYARLYYLEYCSDLDRHIEVDRVSILEVVEIKNLDASLLSACHERGIKLQVYCPGDDPEMYRHAIRSGADFVNVDSPNLAHRIIAEERNVGRDL